jgi:hypothetical protein
VSRADLQKVFMRPDEEIRQEVVGDVLARMLSIGPDRVRATARGGVVTVEGLVEHRSLIPLLAGLVKGVHGVVGVEERLRYETDEALYPVGHLSASLAQGAAPQGGGSGGARVTRLRDLGCGRIGSLSSSAWCSELLCCAVPCRRKIRVGRVAGRRTSLEVHGSGRRPPAVRIRCASS